jgi:hypothetical protein
MISSNYMKNSKIAIIGPSFFGYGNAIANTMTGRGLPAVFIDEIFSKNKLIRAFIRIGLGVFLYPLRYRYYEKIYQSILSDRITHVLLISVECVEVSFVKRLKSTGIHVGLYMWDGLDRKPNCKQILQYIDGFASFDPVDASGHGGKLIHLFAEQMYKINRIPFSSRDNNIAFAGTLHSNRPLVLERITSNLRGSSVRFKGFLYYPSKMAFIVKCLMRPKVFRIFHLVNYKPFSKMDIASLFGKSKYVLDIPHPRQRGLTSRTFEGLMSGARLITSNQTVMTLPPNFVERLNVLSFDNNLIVTTQADEALPDLTADEEYFLSIERFVDQILSFLVGDQKSI